MINMQEQMQGGFANISRQIRALSSSLEPESRQIRDLSPSFESEINQPRRRIENSRQISQQKQSKREHRNDKRDDEAVDDQDIEEIIPEYESDEDQYYYDEAFEQEAAQRKFEKDHKKNIKVRFILFLVYSRSTSFFSYFRFKFIGTFNFSLFTIFVIE
jgi:hypothetical protein